MTTTNVIVLAVSTALAGFIVGALLGLLAGLYFGERRRVRDLQWNTGFSPMPSEADRRAEVVPSPEGDADARARARAERAAVRQGLIAELRARGRLAGVTREEIEAEVSRLVNRLDAEASEEL